MGSGKDHAVKNLGPHSRDFHRSHSEHSYLGVSLYETLRGSLIICAPESNPTGLLILSQRRGRMASKEGGS